MDPEEQVRECKTIDEMRAEIFRFAYHDGLTHRALDSANYLGLSGEDKYVQLAYHALKHRAAVMREYLRLDRMTVRPMQFMIDKKLIDPIETLTKGGKVK